MSSRNLLVLIGAAAIALLAALWVNQTGTNGTPLDEGVGDLLLAEGTSAVRSADTIRLTTATDEILLEKGETGWRLDNRGGYPADTAKINDLLRGLATAERREAKTANPDFFERMDLGANARRLTLAAGDEVLLTLDVGKYEPGRAGADGSTYVYLESDGRAWLVSGLPEISNGPLDWIGKQVADISRARIQGVSVTPASGPAYHLSRPDANASDYEMTDLGTGESISSQSSANAVANAISFMTLEDVRPALDEGPPPAFTLQYDMFDGLSVTVQMFEGEGDAYWARLSASYDEGRMESDTAPDIAQDVPRDGAAEAATFNGRWAGWAFKIASFKARDMAKLRTDLVSVGESAADDGE